MKFGYPVWSEYCLMRVTVPHLQRMAFAEVINCLLVHNRLFVKFINLRNLFKSFSVQWPFSEKSLNGIYIVNDLE